MIKNTEKKVCYQLIAEGNKQAFDLFFRSHYPKLVRFAKYYVKTLELAEDVVADVLTHILSNRKKAFLLDHFDAYLYQSIKNRALNVLKVNSKLYYEDEEDSYLSSIETCATNDPCEIMIGEELDSYLKKIIHHFPEKRKMVYQLIKEESYSYKQVAELMDISERTVEVHLKLAIKDLREAIERFYLTTKINNSSMA